MAVIVNGTEIVLTGTVGQMWWDEDHFTHADVITALAQVGRDADITVRVNSGGGIATEGAAIHAAFAAHKGAVSFHIEGWAASAASLFIMAGRVTMAAGALLMIHEPAGGSWGTAADHRRHADVLDVQGNLYARIYADKTGKSVEEMRAVMREEVWLSPEEAVAKGFADAVDGEQDNEIEPTAFGGVSAYGRAPQRIVALAQARGWSRVTMAAQPAASTTPKGKDAAMSDTKKPAGTEEPKPAAVTTTEAPADAGAIAEACAAANMPATLAASLIKAGATMTAVTERITEAKAIGEAATLAGMPGMGAKLVASGVSLATARDLIAEARASKDESTTVDTAHTNGVKPQASGWSQAVAKLKK